jgi:hypothetical protein
VTLSAATRVIRLSGTKDGGEMMGDVAMTPTRQRNAVSEGMALGLVLCGRDSLPFEKVDVDLAFAGAWRAWEWRNRFPQVNTDLANGLDGTWAMTRATKSKRAWALFWDTSGGQLTVQSRQPDWDPADDDDVDFALGVIDGDVPAEGWMALAREFLRRLDR